MTKGLTIAKYFKTIADACRYQGARGEIVFVMEDCTLRIHGGCECGGKILNAAGLSPADVKDIVQACIEANGLVPVEAVVNPDGSTSIVVDGTAYGDFFAGPHTIDTDTFSSVVVNGDDTVTVTYADGTAITYATGAHMVDTDTFASAVDNGDGTTTVTYADGTTAIYATGPHTEDTDTFGTVALNPDGTATVTFPDGTSAILSVGPHNIDTDTFSTVVDNGDGTVTTTYADGTVVTTATGAHTVDTDTFATVVDNGDGTITTTYADGTIITSSTVDTFASQADGANERVITFPDGSTLCLPKAQCGEVTRPRHTYTPIPAGSSAISIDAPLLSDVITNNSSCPMMAVVTYRAADTKITQVSPSSNPNNIRSVTDDNKRISYAGHDNTTNAANLEINHSGNAYTRCEIIAPGDSLTVSLQEEMLVANQGASGQPQASLAREQQAPCISWHLIGTNG